MSILNPEEVTIDLPDGASIWPTDYFAKDLQLMADVVTRLQLWNWLKTESPPEDTGYMWWGHDNIRKISDGLGSNNNHSGASFACALRNMQRIAKVGFYDWRTEYTKNA